MPIIEIESPPQFYDLINSNDKISIVDFTATWCGPCRMMGPLFSENSDIYNDKQFLKVDVDKFGEISKGEGVKGLPSFFVYKNGIKINQVVGGDKQGFKNLCSKDYNNNDDDNNNNNEQSSFLRKLCLIFFNNK
jgi:thioredoxin 1